MRFRYKPTGRVCTTFDEALSVELYAETVEEQVSNITQFLLRVAETSPPKEGDEEAVAALLGHNRWEVT